MSDAFSHAPATPGFSQDPRTRLEALANATGTRIDSTGHLRIPCPAHGGDDPNLSIGADDQPHLSAKCFSGDCSPADIDAAIRDRYGVSIAPPPRPQAQPRRQVAVYDYLDAGGDLVFQAVRYDPKGFSQRRPDPDHAGQWVWDLKGVETVLYRLPELLASGEAVVWLTEGEKDAERLRSLGLTATTNPMGAGKWLRRYSEALRGRRVAVIPDNDDKGRAHLLKVGPALSGFAASVHVVRPPGAKDVSEWLDQDQERTADDLLQLLRDAPAWEPPPDDPRETGRTGRR